jgi:hypothetical protein
MNYGDYQSEEEYHSAIEHERRENPDTLFDIVIPTKYMKVQTGLVNTNRDFELRYGRPYWRKYGVELDERIPLHFPAGDSLRSTQKIISFRSKQKQDRFTLEGFDIDEVKDEDLRHFLKSHRCYPARSFLFKDFRHAFNYAQGKPAKLKWAKNITIKADRRGIPQLHRWV